MGEARGNLWKGLRGVDARNVSKFRLSSSRNPCILSRRHHWIELLAQSIDFAVRAPSFGKDSRNRALIGYSKFQDPGSSRGVG